MYKITSVMVMTLLLSINVFAAEQSGDMFHIGVRPGVTLADGEPANDILSVGVFSRYRLTDSWLLGIALDKAEFDFEDPARVIGLNAAEVVDATTTEYLISAWVEREFNTPNDWLTPFLGAGLGIGIVETEDVTGPLAGGGTFDITTDPGTEIIPSVLAGLRFSLGEMVFAEVTAHADYRFTTWDIQDRTSGTTGTIEDYFTYGSYVGLGIRF